APATTWPAHRLRCVCFVMCLGSLTGCGGSPPSSPPAAAGDKPSQAVGRSSESSTKQTEQKRGRRGPVTLDDALALAQHSLKTLEKVKDYTGEFSKRERVGGELLPEERDAAKIRHQPFSVYLKVIKPQSSAGQEVIYVEGRNDGNLIAHTTGFGSNVIGRLSLDPHGFLATRSNRYTIKDVGLKNLVIKLLDLGKRKELFRESQVAISKVDFADRPCKQVEISSPHAIGDFRLAIARIVLDDEWDVPVHFESHEWPAEGGDKPVLSETYSYYDLHFDVGLTDRDFDPDNPDYAFP
ncbi:MAG: DUF1571 domain-containing protein, partial [Pirellulales bacterium]